MHLGLDLGVGLIVAFGASRIIGAQIGVRNATETEPSTIAFGRVAKNKKHSLARGRVYCLRGYKK